MSETNSLKLIKSNIEQSIQLKQAVLADNELIQKINSAANQCLYSFNQGKRMLLAGNGGSAADAQHIAAELVCRFNFERPGLPAMALATNYSVITAAGNDYSYEDVFAREIEANGQAGDIFVAISTSGNSKNIINAVKAAKKKDIFVIGLSGKGGLLMTESDICINIPSSNTPRIQECHIMVGHILCEIIENTLFKD
ncbi:MAG: SIS domain-containing protein [Gammaproteobacteria bacterium]|nr:SIS domain-containing protein [Gammaproteobacteria bacterium]